MLKIAQVDHVNMSVHNFEESINFYKNVFGMEIKQDGTSLMSGERFVIIGLKNKIYLCLYEGLSKDLESERIGHLGFYIQDFEQAHKDLKKNNIEILYGGLVDYPNGRSIYIQDPNGFEWELSEVLGGGLD